MQEKLAVKDNTIATLQEESAALKGLAGIKTDIEAFLALSEESIVRLAAEAIGRRKAEKQALTAHTMLLACEQATTGKRCNVLHGFGAP